VRRLPEKYRTVIVLCELEGKTKKEVAQQLNLPEGTVASRVARARTMLAKQLARHGAAVSGGSLTSVLSEGAAFASLPTSLAASAVKAITQHSAAGVISANVAAITEGVLKAMFLTKLKIGTALVLAVMFLVGGARMLTYHTVAAQPAEPNKQPPNKVVEPPVKAEAKSEPAPPKSDVKVPTNTSSRTKALIQERLETLQKIADRVRLLNERGTVPNEAVRKANLRVYRAELDLCDETAKDRIAILEKFVGVHKEIEDQISNLAKRGVVPTEDMDEARVNRLEAEIELEREKTRCEKQQK
jgi:hypothetical protein